MLKDAYWIIVSSPNAKAGFLKAKEEISDIQSITRYFILNPGGEIEDSEIEDFIGATKFPFLTHRTCFCCVLTGGRYLYFINKVDAHLADGFFLLHMGKLMISGEVLSGSQAKNIARIGQKLGQKKDN